MHSLHTLTNGRKHLCNAHTHTHTHVTVSMNRHYPETHRHSIHPETHPALYPEGVLRPGCHRLSLGWVERDLERQTEREGGREGERERERGVRERERETDEREREGERGERDSLVLDAWSLPSVVRHKKSCQPPFPQQKHYHYSDRVGSPPVAGAIGSVCVRAS